MKITLFGYRHSVYVRIVRVALEEKKIVYSLVEIDPFAENVPPEFFKLHPFGRIPVLMHDQFALYETSAITRYIDCAFAGPILQPRTPQLIARMSQLISLVDNYGYWPMVRQVFSHRIFRLRVGLDGDEQEVQQGLVASERVLGAIEGLVGSGNFLVGEELTLADIHLGPMMAYFCAAPEGAALLCNFPKLDTWWKKISRSQTLMSTDPLVEVNLSTATYPFVADRE